MNINDLTKNLDKTKLNRAASELGTVMKKDELNQALNALKSMSAGEIKEKLSGVSASDISNALAANPSLQAIINKNPNISKNINSLINNAKK